MKTTSEEIYGKSTQDTDVD